MKEERKGNKGRSSGKRDHPESGKRKVLVKKSQASDNKFSTEKSDTPYLKKSRSHSGHTKDEFKSRRRRIGMKQDDDASQKRFQSEYENADHQSKRESSREGREWKERKESKSNRGDNRLRKHEFEKGYDKSAGRKEGKSQLIIKKKSGGQGKWKQKPSEDEGIRLNKFIANAGICSRREADELITAGAIRVNANIVTELGTRITPTDKVYYEDQLISGEKPVYLLLNKPKGYVTTSDDPQSRKTVMHLIDNACRERIYPVGRLDLNTSGVLLFTNDGDLAMKLTHPSHHIRKVYHVVLDKNFSRNDFLSLEKGLELEDGFVRPDAVAYVGDGKDKKQLGMELHSGKNRIVRRMFEHLGYKVTRLDRVEFAGLTKKDLQRGKWRFLTSQEIAFLKML